ncbi:hypothetical protein [Flagellimonas olearia]|uniref:Uncharacterized protein n=1 Tax=Flagellimonas olearia TaxID=552546 RepID=A0A444VP59_9FLAO|nr:hypothetical protein [Allomuricauda olearia]RYC52597.1 hypothetical protein DN53_07665 [Allomuricauda olearia]
MKKNGTFLFFLSCLSLLLSCTKQNEELTIESLHEEFSTFKKAFPNLYVNINPDYIQKSDINSLETLTAKAEVGITFPIIENEKVIGRYFGLCDESIALYIDYSDYENQIVIYNVNNSAQFAIVEMELNLETLTYIPIQVSSKEYSAKGSSWCAVSCGIGATAIALSDGPAPLMDLVAVTYMAACLTDCELG